MQPDRATTPAQRKTRVLTVSFDLEIESVLGAGEAPCELMRMEADLEKLMEPVEPRPDIIICGPAPEKIALVEIAQALRMQYQDIPIYYVTPARIGYDRKLFIKNGFTDSFLLPLDISILRAQMKDTIAKITSGAQKAYRPVKLIDIAPGTTLDFDTTLFLPMNNKYIPYTNSGDPIDGDRLKKLQNHKINSIYVSSEQMPKFYQYTAGQLQKLGAAAEISATEKKEKLETSIRELMSGIFNDSSKEASFEQGQALVKDCQEIIKSYILSSPTGNWYNKLLSAMGDQSTGYSHSANVSTYASLFSIGLQIGNPCDLATAGLLHDIGLTDVPQEIVNKPEAERSPEERAAYERHCEHSINIIKGRRISIPETVQKAILQHHECFDGSGYPNGLVGSRTSAEAQILALADRFDELTSAAEGKPLMSPVEAVLYFKKMLADDPGKMIFDPELLRKVLKLFPES